MQQAGNVVLKDGPLVTALGGTFGMPADNS